MIWIEALIGLILVALAIFTIVQKDLLLAVIGTGAISLFLSISFFLLKAPDVALTEAAIGVALTTIIFIITIRKTKRNEECDDC